MLRRDVYGDRRAGSAVAAVAIRRVGRSGAIWGLAFGALIASTMSTYVSAFPTAEGRATVAQTLKDNTAFAALLGVIRHPETVAGYTNYKVTYTLLVIGSIWGLLTATRLLRGEEDGGRWELFLSGQTTRGRAAGGVAVGLGAGLVAMWIPTATIAAAMGASSKIDISAGTSIFFATAVVSGVAMFMAVGMLASQLAASRHDANMIGAGVLAGTYLVRMAADSDASVGWLRWAGPLGWIEELRPLTGSKPFAFIPIVLFTVAACALAVGIASRRDLGASVIAGRDTREPRTFLLGGQAQLTLLLTRTTALAWLVVLAVSGLFFGLVTQAAGNALRGVPSMERVIARLGGTRGGSLVYLGYVFVVAAGLVAIAVAGQIAAIRNEEAVGYLDNLLVRPVARRRWLAVRLGLGAGFAILAGATVGAGAWIGATTQHSHVGIGELLEGGLNIVPPSLFVLGVGGLIFGLWPRAASTATYGLVIWSFVAETVAAVVDSNHWLRDTSPFLHITPAPAASPDWTSAGWLVVLGLLAGVAGIVTFARRDVAGT